MSQEIIRESISQKNLEGILRKFGIQKYLLVCGSSFLHLNISRFFDEISIPYIRFTEFKPNPLYEDVCKGVVLFNYEKCDAIVAVGGGSALDVAKCIKLYAKMDTSKNYLEQEYKDTGIPLVAIPTTAGTGSESTRYAVIYFEGNKQSVTHKSIVPNCTVLDHSVLRGLPLYQKKCTMLDALCQGIESWWSVNSTDESKEYSRIAVEMIMKHKDAYLNGDHNAAEQIMLASNYAGRAINITQTTAPHAMSYKLTSMYGIPHGHAVAICLPQVWKYMIHNLEQCIDKRGTAYLIRILDEISIAMGAMGFGDTNAAISGFNEMLIEMGINVPQIKDVDLQILTDSVNITRLGNHPVKLSAGTLYQLYSEIQERMRG